ncbi:MAG: hypothetical protein M3308_09560, partial [Actinomycetota bacterium]|nr:hypothetical protein [Actinomycetota bacterium]
MGSRDTTGSSVAAVAEHRSVAGSTDRSVAGSTHRSVLEIGTTTQGPRPVPPLGQQRAPRVPAMVDTTLDNGLRVIAVQRPAVPMV